MRRLFEDRNEHMLTLCLRVPPSSGFLVYYIHSPVVVIDRFIGDEDDIHAPEWLRTQRLERRFWQQRSLMLDLLLYFAADLPENRQLHSSVENWCKAVSVSTLLDLQDIVITDHASKGSCIRYDNFYPLPCARQLPLSLQYPQPQATFI